MISPIEHQVAFLDSDLNEELLFPSLYEQQENNMSSTNLSALSEESSPDLMDENDCGNGSEFLQTENVGIVTPVGEEAKPNTTAKVEEKKTEEKPKVVPVEKDNNDPAQVGLPSKFDVLCGQSRICANHTGNRRFQVVLDIYAPKYEQAKSKQEKMMLTKEIVGCIGAASGRFLKYKDGMWIEISNVTARDKVSHALRTKVQSWKRQRTEKASPPKKKSSSPIRKRRNNTRRRSAPAVVTSGSDIRAVSFDGSTASSTSIMDELLRTQREIFEQLTQSDKPAAKQTHPLKRTETWS